MRGSARRDANVDRLPGPRLSLARSAMRSRSISLVAPALLLLLVVVRADARAQAALRPLSVEALVDLNTLSYWGIGSLSPDGQWLVHTVREGARLRGRGGAEGESYLPTGLSPDYTAGTNLYL